MFFSSDIETNSTMDTINVPQEICSSVTRLESSEIFLGDLVGQGAFCDVYDLKAITYKSSSNLTEKNLFERRPSLASTNASFSDSDESEFTQPSLDWDWENNHMSKAIHSRDYIRENALVNGTCKYVVKRLRPTFAQGTTDEDVSIHRAAVADLAMETHMLLNVVVSHPNIIQMRAISVQGPPEAGFFMVMDKLPQTLADKMEEDWRCWSQNASKKSSFFKRKLSGLIKSSSSKTPTMKRSSEEISVIRNAIWSDKMSVAGKIASALEHLHSNGIIYRDIKPQNIGFDALGETKLFDFGLARDLSEAEMSMDDCEAFNLTACTGTIRYMAPEVALGKPYNDKVDVYALSVLVWQMLTLETPYAGHSKDMYFDKVARDGARPALPASFPASTCELLETCWAETHQERLCMSEMREALNKQSQIDF